MLDDLVTDYIVPDDDYPDPDDWYDTNWNEDKDDTLTIEFFQDISEEEKNKIIARFKDILDNEFDKGAWSAKWIKK